MPLNIADQVVQLVLEVTRELVENGLDPIERIASKASFGDAQRMRCAFVRNFDQPPHGMRHVVRIKVAQTALVSGPQAVRNNPCQ
jgi:transcriptional regulator GlxA family with amidase domain